ncbi:uncharacterized protein MYCFIDRAFT_42205 [Pseudocercospora fijiensis CIRAD86]|uniref:NCT transcriptional regulatory complex subunit B n=1 Tax=Pseudocercospora fijiensis (strain CIRAD86) TaxID=383855 RepID=M3AIB8_PSEFD|nr:uncharacterized protein MYCFIDRAFT_42205 [Pseudocercospora fijiensis CIRAD86]EME77217.1 hypothetical protein MYCFIDRAFT_42205 [Pseudocercospora fijiensis CIRAD86]
MSDKEFGGIVSALYKTPRTLTFAGNDDLSLPKATVQKIINEVLNTNPALAESGQMTFAKETRDLLIECCVEFITMLSSQANDIAEKEAKKTIACEHITKALEELEFPEYVPELNKVAGEFKVEMGRRERKQTKIEQSGMSEEELRRMQEELFKSAGDKYTAGGE